jgi:hypothetical protein
LIAEKINAGGVQVHADPVYGWRPIVYTRGGQASDLQQRADLPDVRKFCSKLALGSPDRAYQDCLEMNRDKVSAKCQRALGGQRP